MSAGLPVSRLINIIANLQPAAAQFPSVTTAMFIGDSNVIDVQERYRSYASLAEVAADFGTSAPEYHAAALFFGQSPSPQQLYIGVWAEAATSGLLYCGALSLTEQAIATWQAIGDGGFKISIDGGAVTAVTNLVFTGLLNLNAVATQINTRMAAAGLAATCSWNGSQFVFQSTSTGVLSSVSALTAAAVGDTDISAMLKGTAATLSKLVPGIAAESPLAALRIIEDKVRFYMLKYATAQALSNDQIEAVAAYVEGDTANPHLYLLTVSDPNALLAANTTDIGYILRQLAYERTGYQWSSTTAFAAASIAGRMATVDYTAPDSTITLAYKIEPGVLPESLTSSQADALEAKGYNYYATYDNGQAIIFGGTVAAPSFYLDDIQGTDAFVGAIRTNLFNALVAAPKIPQTDPGVHTLVTNINKTCGTFLSNGQLGPGTWEANGFGTLKTGDYLENGYYAFANSVASQATADRLARKSPPITVAGIYAGAVQKVYITLNIQR